MADEKKRRLYGGSYDDQINDTYNQITNRPAFNYDVDGDALYQQYKDRYTQNAKMAMQDTMGQAAALTGGYGSSYGQAAGQQAYDRTIQGLTDMIPTLQQSAYQRYQDQGNALKDQYSMLNSMGAAEQATNQAAYSQLAQMISSTGYQPTADDLTKAGMNAQQANALRQMWIASNPGAAYMNGQLSAGDYFKLTGQYPPDVAAAARYGGPPASDVEEEVEGYTNTVRGSMTSGFTITNSNKKKSPKTEDAYHIFKWTVSFIASMVVSLIAALLLRRKK